MANIIVDASDFDAKAAMLLIKAKAGVKKAITDIANEILRLSQLEVPHDIGLLQNSGFVDPDGEDMIVGYNKSYAAYQHEGVRADETHIVRHWQHGRKSKYLEDPIKNNLTIFQQYFKSILG